MDLRKLKVCVTGAAGNIAYSLLPMIASGQMFGPRTKVLLTLLDLPEFQYSLKGIIMELEDSAYPFLAGTDYGSDPKKMFKDCDIVIFLGGASRLPGQERRDLLQFNGKIFQDQGQALNEVGKKTCKCLVVANPCNTNCWILQQNCPKIPMKNFTALSRLDHNRAQSLAAIKLNVEPTKVKKMVVWGNHSSLQFPDVSFCEIGGKKFEDSINDLTYLRKEFVKTIQNRGAEVLFQRKKSSGFSAAKAIADHMKDWSNGTDEGNWISMSVISDGTYGIPKGLVFSMPVVCNNFEYEIVKDLSLNEYTKQQIEIGIEELEEEKELAVEEL
jgi:malate dehydrogenase